LIILEGSVPEFAINCGLWREVKDAGFCHIVSEISATYTHHPLKIELPYVYAPVALLIAIVLSTNYTKKGTQL
jgi:hypothetical protein